VVTVEIDKSLIPLLKSNLKDYKNVLIINADFLNYDFQNILNEFNNVAHTVRDDEAHIFRDDEMHAVRGDEVGADTPERLRRSIATECDKIPLGDIRPIKVVANLPYYITTPIIMSLFESHMPLESVTVMVQKEVAQRICAAPGSADYSAFSVFCRYYAEPEILFEVPPSCFLPQPKVTSAVLTLRVRTESPCEIADEAMFFRVVRAAFAQRRKTLSNALAAGFPEQTKAELTDCIVACGHAPTVRGETLSIPEFAALARAIAER
jgi:ribosomal RNA small subunit methyltransferase A